jgi:hypothetical protein
MWDVGCEVSNTVYRLLFTVYDFNGFNNFNYLNDFPFTAHRLLLTVCHLRMNEFLYSRK